MTSGLIVASGTTDVVSGPTASPFPVAARSDADGIGADNGPATTTPASSVVATRATSLAIRAGGAGAGRRAGIVDMDRSTPDPIGHGQTYERSRDPNGWVPARRSLVMVRLGTDCSWDVDERR